MPVNELLRWGMGGVLATLNSHRMLLYTLVSTVAVSSAITSALKNQSNFYSLAISLSKSSRSVLALANFGFILVLLCGRVVQQIFFGTLRPLEIERLYDRLWFFVTESLLAFTIFRDEFDLPFALMFAFLLFVKSFHWLASDRVEWMDQTPYPGPSLLFHIRISTLSLILCLTDFAMVLLAADHIMTNGVGGMVLFACEYAILITSVVNTATKYILSTYEIRRAHLRGGENAPPWDNKSIWTFYIELATDFLKLTTYLVFFTVIITTYGLPLNIIRDVYITARSFVTRFGAFRRYQAATRNMNERYPNATEAELSAMSDRTCIICREEMILRTPSEQASHASTSPSDGPNTTPKRLPCAHVFHFHCLRSWLERQQNCPTCRRPVLHDQPQQTAPPRPGARPVPQRAAIQPPNPPPVAQAAPVNGQGNWLGRWPLNAQNAPPQHPIAQRQFHVPFAPPAGLQNGPPLQNQQLPPPNVVVQYHFPYDPRYHAQQPRTPPVDPRQLLPLPIYPGFYGPGNVWQPWVVDGRWFVQGQNVPANTPDQPQAADQSHPPSFSDSSGSSSSAPSPITNITQPTSEAVTCLATPGEGSNTVNADGQGAVSATAAQPATLSNPQGPGTQTSSESDDPPPSFNFPTSSTSSTPHVSTNPTRTLQPGSTSASGMSSAVNRTSLEDGPTQDSESSRPQVPMMIPLYDYGATSQPQTPYSPQNAARLPLSRFSGSTRMGAPSYPYTTPQLSPNRSGVRRSQAPQTPISQLPPALTDEQLAIMDNVTREAIDERLRVLEGVSGAVTRCIEDLVRMRSALPISPARSMPNQSQPLTSQGEIPLLRDLAAGACASSSTDSSGEGFTEHPKANGHVDSSPSNSTENVSETRDPRTGVA